jgi:Ribbon-helix-helix protein, copG family
MTRRASGRPRVDPTERSVPVSVRLPANQYDALYHHAKREGVSIPSLIRRYIPKASNKGIKTPGY